MLSPLFTSIYYCRTGFSISECPEMEQCRFSKLYLKLCSVFPPKLLICLAYIHQLINFYLMKPQGHVFAVICSSVAMYGNRVMIHAKWLG